MMIPDNLLCYPASDIESIDCSKMLPAKEWIIRDRIVKLYRTKKREYILELLIGNCHSISGAGKTFPKCLRSFEISFAMFAKVYDSATALFQEAQSWIIKRYKEEQDK